MTDGVVILGGGASGTLTAVALAALPDVGPLTLVDQGGAFARGVAYSTEEPRHLLNIPAGRMSAIPD
ncbi:MAG TPA: FAD/NAD(P)-binding protein, partial [Myxococcaceae bacterium]|nr:FAD/NAD(P)-binding protein [Myxococcaceae bacterium]